MIVKRLLSNIAASDLSSLRRFYGDVLGMRIVMDHGWIVTLEGAVMQCPQISLATEGGSETPVPDLSVEVDDLEEAYQRMLLAGFVAEYGPITEPWGVRRFFVRDPAGRLVNVLVHA